MYAQHFTCMTCFQEEGIPPEEFHLFPLNDDIAFIQECSKGHKNFVIYQTLKFELLFEIATNALIDGYADASCSRFAASLERFYEFYTKAILLYSGLSLDRIDEMWKPLKKLSERQYGAFSVAWEMDVINRRDNNIKIELPIKNRIGKMDFIQFRNEVIHNGYIPPLSETKEYAYIIYSFIEETLLYLKSQYSKEVDILVQQRWKQNHNNYKVSSICPPTIISHVMRDTKFCKDFDEVISRAKEASRFGYSPKKS
ncbi:MAG: hypothetical protein COV35_08085 [Alphaproteobacteria bacterium CG11_big_fil_rev_8_21_14_0_20_39_49]|nr:MAG: hypothetical protein COV35_08085 [Alphaproteobacteria bacterium CG11_big_fil_rev_8_21_14_0_20_39_49]